MLRIIFTSFIVIVLIAGCYSSRTVEKRIEPEREVIIHEPAHEHIIIHDPDGDDTIEKHRKTTIQEDDRY